MFRKDQHKLGFLVFLVFSFFIVYLELANRIMSERTTNSEASLLWYHVITCILFNIYITVSFIITTSYWVGVTFDLISPTKSAASVNFHVHVINAVLASKALFVGNLSIPILHFYCPLAFGAVYLFFTLILHWAGEISTIYAVLDWMEGPGMAVGYALGILLIAVPLFHFIFTWGISELRQYLFKNRAKLKSFLCTQKKMKYDISSGIPNDAFHSVNKRTDSANDDSNMVIETVEFHYTKPIVEFDINVVYTGV